MAALLLLHLVAGLFGIALGGRLGRRGLLLAAVPMVATLGWLASQTGTILDDQVVTQSIRWVPALDVEVVLRLDGFSGLMAVLVSGIGLLVLAYGWSYLPEEKEGLGRLIGLVTLFAGSMLGLVLADNLIVLYGFWELTSITSFLLIGNDHRDGKARAAALQALLVTGAGGLAMLAGFIVLGQAAGTYSLSGLLADPPEATTAVVVALVLILLGAFTKSAQVPFHSWLPGAMVAPTPVSAYLHSATMVKAGVYLIARLAPVFAAPVDLWRPLVATVGATTMVVGGLRALRQTDLKLLLAMGTVSQLGMMVAVFGWGSDKATEAGVVLLLSHAAYKCASFMVVGILDHQHGTRDVRALPRPGPGWGWTTASVAIAAASMAGVPLVLGFVAKEGVLEAFTDAGKGTGWVLAAITVGSAITVAYSLRLVAGATGLLGRPVVTHRAHASHPGTAPTLAFVAAPLLLSAFTVVYGLQPSLLDALDSAATTALVAADTTVHLALWHGWTLALGLSVVAFVVGTLMFVARQPVERVLAVGHDVPLTSAGLYAGSLRLMNRVADRVTGLVQFGSLPGYIGVILFTSAALPGVLLLTEGAWPGWPDLTTTWVHVPVVTVILTAALAAAAVRRRFTAALFLGVTGYAMAGLFVVQGAPDLALTQVGIETLTTVLFVLVLRRLPDRFESRTPPWRRGLRLLVASTVGLTIFGLALLTGDVSPETPASDTMLEESLPEGDGRNVVNVILADFRGFDTLGEISVLAAAAIGTVALARAGRRPGPVPPAHPTPDTKPSSPRAEAPAGHPVDHEQPGRTAPPPVRLARLVTLDTSVRVAFVAVMVGSVYLLFAGHNQPGGGFAGGIVAGSAIALRYIAGGIGEVRALSRSRPWTVLGSGILLAATVALLPLLFGDAVLEAASWTIDPPLIGTVKVTSALFFDIGVYLVVVGLTLMMFESFGDDPPPEPEESLGTAVPTAEVASR
jgi:multicomponent Na+:H+ antiporter subunit A